MRNTYLRLCPSSGSSASCLIHPEALFLLLITTSPRPQAVKTSCGGSTLQGCPQADLLSPSARPAVLPRCNGKCLRFEDQSIDTPGLSACLAAWLPVRGETCCGLYYVCSNMGHADPQTHKSGTIHTPLSGIGNGARGERQEGGHSAQQAQRCCPAIFLFSVTDVETESFPVGPTHLVFYVFKLNQCRICRQPA